MSETQVAVDDSGHIKIAKMPFVGKVTASIVFVGWCLCLIACLAVLGPARDKVMVSVLWISLLALLLYLHRLDHRTHYLINSEGIDIERGSRSRKLDWADVADVSLISYTIAGHTVAHIRFITDNKRGTRLLLTPNKNESHANAAGMWDRIRSYACPALEQRLTACLAEQGSVEVQSGNTDGRDSMLGLTLFIILGMVVGTIIYARGGIPTAQLLRYELALGCMAAISAAIGLLTPRIWNRLTASEKQLTVTSAEWKKSFNKNWVRINECSWEDITKILTITKNGQPLSPSPEYHVYLPSVTKPIIIKPYMRNYTLFVLLLKRLKKIPE